MEASANHCPLTPHAKTPFHLRLGLALLEADRPQEARAALQGASFEDHGSADPTTVPLHHWALACTSWLVGRWDSVAIEVEAGLVRAEAGEGAVQGAALAGVGVVVAIHRDELARARGLLARVRRQLAADAAPCPLWSQGTEALVVEAEGQPDLALQVLADGWDRAGPVRHLSAYRLFGPELVRLALLGGCRRRAASVTDEVEESAARLVAPAAQASARRCRGLLQDDSGVLLQAVDALREVPRPLELASACEEAAASLERADRANLAASLFAEAFSAYRSLGARRDMARVAAFLAPDDLEVVAVPGPSPSVARDSGRRRDGGLTTRELEVLELMAAGLDTRAMAKRLFLSHNTVRNHAQSVLRKLKVHSRLEAVSVARREHLLQPPYS